MATRPLDDDQDDGVLELEEDDQIDSGDVKDAGDDASGDAQDDDDAVVVGFGDDIETEQPSDSDLVKQLRRQLRDARKTPAAPATETEIEIPVLGPEPTLESCDYDEDRLREETRAWVRREAEIERLKAARVQKQESAKAQWQATWDDFATKRDALKARDFEDAETAVITTLTKEQQLIIVGGCENSAAMILALGRSPTKLNEIANVKDPLKFAVALGKLEKDLKVSRRKPPQPDTPSRGSAPLSANSDKELERLEREADKTGDRTAIIEYKRKLREKRAA